MRKRLSILGSQLALTACCGLLAMAAGLAQAKDLLVVGNSLTRHGPAPELGWQGDWGMAASSADKDFVHRLVARLEQTQVPTTGQNRSPTPPGQVQITIVPGFPIESRLLSEWPASPPFPASEAPRFDYIVVEIGDNVDFRNPLAASFGTRYDALLTGLVQTLRPAGRLACLGRWWADAAADGAIKAACARHGGVYVGLAPVAARVQAHAQQERSYSNRGVGEHPGDRGMADIADLVFCALVSPCLPKTTGAGRTSPDIGVFYFPGWQSQSRYWKDIKGQADSRSPGQPWPDREPLLGYYAEEDPRVAEQHIEWASQYGITFFAYDWYWEGKSSYLNHAIDNFIKAPNNKKLRFSLLWANHSEVPRSMAEFDAMLTYWLANYLLHPQFYRVAGKPVIFVYSYTQLDLDARKFGATATALLDRAQGAARARGLPGLFFVATTNQLPEDRLEDNLSAQGFSAYSGWNYVAAQDKSAMADYTSMVNTYLNFYTAASSTKGKLPYIVPLSPGWDSRPWQGTKAVVRTDPTPEKFQVMLTGARQLLDRHKPSIMNIVMIEAWNEFGEGAYVEPTKKWQFEYLKRIQGLLQ